MSPRLVDLNALDTYSTLGKNRMHSDMFGVPPCSIRTSRTRAAPAGTG
eukprot:CAMPEP_0114645196 /NCGR_PEP_ID=MMETSP0191-20121206/4408_1 /TAXON_ID=126664 /ORGANISM="Sorites sp." /LENGTH=47 /DNA_ID= /DNA_START= /DNA_END= /DNA_ORIENTATION=